MNIYSVKQIRLVEKTCINELNIDELNLMTRSGAATLRCLKKYWPKARHITVVCGSGNNAGDGFMFALLAHQAGLHVIVQYLEDMDTLQGAAMQAAKRCQQSGVVMQRWYESVLKADVIVDAILGTGLVGVLREHHMAFIAATNHARCPILSIDVPSGVHADTGDVCSVVMAATVTLSLIGIKRGLLTGEAISYVGSLECDDLVLPKEAFQDIFPLAHVLQYDHFTDLLKPRKKAAHKGLFGHVLMVGGDVGYSGAVIMAALAAARTGAGRVSVATHVAHAAFLNALHPEIMVHACENEKALQALMDKASVIVVGPGLGQTKWAKQLLNVAMETTKPLVVDADALNLLAQKPEHKLHWIFTPHAAEAARLLQISTSAVQANRFGAAQDLQKRYGGIVILKGAGTIIDHGETQQDMCAEGNPGMATAGMGDILTGIIGGLLAQGLGLLVAARLAVCVHARAGDRAAMCGERGLMATDLLPFIRELVNP